MSNSNVYVFDMDGVILDSLDKLSECLIQSIKPFCQSDSQFQEFSRFDKENPGLSRFEKTDFFIKTLPTSDHISTLQLRDSILDNFQRMSLQARLSADLEDSVLSLTDKISPEHLILLSNCDNSQLDAVVAHFGFHRIFKGGRLGTPPSKLERFRYLKELQDSVNFISISDSKSDAEISRSLGLTFVFIQKFARDNAPWLLHDEYRFNSIGDFLVNLKNLA